MKKFSGSLLKGRREKRKMTQAQLALALSNHFSDRIIPVQSISDWERGNYSPSAESLAALSIVMDCSIDIFFANTVQSSNEPTNNKNGKRKAA
jgi:transcriptional regulator with XRE-family HTH domain